MRITKGYWVWGLFPSRETNLLNEIKAKVQSKLKSPDFATHITLSGPYLQIGKPFFIESSCISLNSLRLTAAGFSIITALNEPCKLEITSFLADGITSKLLKKWWRIIWHDK